MEKENDDVADQLASENNCLVSRWKHTKFSGEDDKLLIDYDVLLEKLQGVPVSFRPSLDVELVALYNALFLNWKYNSDPSIHQLAGLAVTTLKRVSEMLMNVLSRVNVTDHESNWQDVATLLEKLCKAEKEMGRKLWSSLVLPTIIVLLHLMMDTFYSDALSVIESLQAVKVVNEEECNTGHILAKYLVDDAFLDESGYPSVIVLDDCLSVMKAAVLYHLGSRNDSILAVKAIETDCLKALVCYLKAVAGMADALDGDKPVEPTDPGELIELAELTELVQDSQLQPLALNLVGSCLAAKGKPHMAIQCFQQSLQASRFTYLLPLYHVAQRYRALHMYDAELEALNLLVKMLQNVKRNSLSSNASTVLDLEAEMSKVMRKDISLEAATYTTARRCAATHHQQAAFESYLSLLALLLNNPMLEISWWPVPFPGIRHTFHEAARAAICCGKLREAVVICDWMIAKYSKIEQVGSGGSIATADDPDPQPRCTDNSRQCSAPPGVKSGHIDSTDVRQTTGMYNSCCGTRKPPKVIHCLACASLLQCNEHGSRQVMGTNSQEMPGSRDALSVRVITNITPMKGDGDNTPGGGGGSDTKEEFAGYCCNSECDFDIEVGKLDTDVIALMLKCEALVQMNDISAALESFSRLLPSLYSVFPSEAKQLEAKCNCLLRLKAEAHLKRGLLLAEMGQPSDSVHQLRQSLQCNRDGAVAMFNYVLLMLKQGCCVDAARSWCVYRKLPNSADTFQLTMQIGITETQLRATHGGISNIRDLESVKQWPFNRSPMLSDMLVMDRLMLQTILQTRKST
ncbi:PREDICTED: uncharacterized protein LOC106805663 isoform X2 [Priapulus caudatus]|uniref:Uncharacterized protein LOC106805663 isoform X2 n=1 Tax=Priapulus caudatus TaxID=37621 RepID=A0ABM1DSB9_PRICU|nr:PREDICTED: uncharacterized protein LOC106805663 isoform X2 [Priapulus caudatus]